MAMTTATPMTKKEAVLDCLRNKPSLMNAPYTEVINAVRSKHGIDVSENYVYTLRREKAEMDTKKVVEMPRNNGTMNREQTIPIPVTPKVVPVVKEQEEEPKGRMVEEEKTITATTIIDFKTIEPAMDMMVRLSEISSSLGGLDNVILLAQNMKKIGVR